MKKDANIIFRIRKKDKEDFEKMTKDLNIPMSEYLYDIIKRKLEKWRKNN